jgi:exodeoxyribonuclease VII small subunit
VTPDSIEPRADVPEKGGDNEFADMTFKEMSDKLEGIVRLLEGNQLEIEEALHSYELGVRLLRELQFRLSSAQQQVTVLMGELDQEGIDDIDTSLS